MPHVLLKGDERSRDRLRALLTQWGLTVGVLPSTGHLDALPTVEDCDAIVLVGDDRTLREARLASRPDGAGVAADSAAPLLIVGLDPMERGPWTAVPALDPEGLRLREALGAALLQARKQRDSGDGGERLPDEWRHELGHELRSPLTAIKMALEVMEGDIGRADAEDPAVPANLRMLEIALRNVQRLHRAVEWNEEILAHADTSEAETAPLRRSTTYLVQI